LISSGRLLRADARAAFHAHLEYPVPVPYIA
jgi:hypothetical protein